MLEVGIHELPGGDVDADHDRGGAVVAPLARLRTRLLEDPGAHRRDQPGLLGERDEVQRRHQAVPGPLPAHQRLGGDDRAGLEVDDRLVVDHQLVALERLPEPVQDVEPGDRPVLHGGIEERAAVLPALLHAVHGEVRAPQQLLGVERFLRQRDPDARAQRDLAAGQVERRGEQRADALGRGQRVVEAADGLEQHGELVAAQSRDGVRRAGRLVDPLCGGGDQLVAAGVAEPVVDELEVVEVDHQHGHALARAQRAVERVARAVLEQRAVRDAGERIGEGLPLELVMLALERLGHPVQGVGQLVQLARGGHGHAVGELPAAERPRRLGQPADRAQRGRGQATGELRGDAQRGEQRDEGHEGLRAVEAAGRRQVAADLEL